MKMKRLNGREREGDEREIKHAIGINTQVWKLTRKIMQERREKKKGGMERKTEKEGEPALGHRRNRHATRAPSNCGLIFQPSVSMTTPSTTLPIFARNFGMKSDRDLIFWCWRVESSSFQTSSPWFFYAFRGPCNIAVKMGKFPHQKRLPSAITVDKTIESAETSDLLSNQAP